MDPHRKTVVPTCGYILILDYESNVQGLPTEFSEARCFDSRSSNNILYSRTPQTMQSILSIYAEHKCHLTL